MSKLILLDEHHSVSNHQFQMIQLQNPSTSFAKAASFRSISDESPFWIGNLIHLYVELEINLNLEGAESITNARTAHKYIRKAADAAFLTAELFGGEVLEIHGRTLHLGIPYQDLRDVENLTFQPAGLLHVLLKRAYRSGGPSGWRMGSDHGTTLTITSVGIHDDTSLVSLSPAANLPAKKLGNDQVPLHQIGSRIHGHWSCEELDSIALRLNSTLLAKQNSYGRDLLAEVMVKQAQVVELKSLASVNDINMQAEPVGNPTGDNLFSCYGYVLSMDLDGFTKRVAEVADGSPSDQEKLARDFYNIMEKSSSFAAQRQEKFIQFPFAGDNAIFALTTKDLQEFEVLKKVTPISIAVDWDDQMTSLAHQAGFGGWGQAAAGGDSISNANSLGNLHVSGIQLGHRRFLVGIGPGMRFSRQAFAHTEPSPSELTMYKPNISDLHPRLANKFRDCEGPLSNISAYFKKSHIDDLRTELQRLTSEKNQTIESVSNPQIVLTGTHVIHRPHAWPA